ncbi:hypothetical protein Sps_05123 [Shewanella psychrophila]|uniref:Uncharacterized protein n=1 Tax=Shewanella psychrophila TaxID=225848 RepID=A0A1S6HXI7_9GAMM|nr:hypothetical protein [Shewanella psychrophila]AQS40192.1 hypothetical protein Sps_05123 [Shewanella psychrophila]
MTEIDTITLSEPLLWLNRDKQKRVATSMTRALNGAPHINQVPIAAGLTIVLGTSDTWITRTEFEEVQQHSFLSFIEFTLVIDGQSFQVIWDHSQGAAVTGTNLFEEFGGHEDLTDATFRFLTV